jgi:TPR repeat protein
MLSFVLSSGAASAADINKGIEAVKLGDFRTALSELTPIAQQGHANAQYYLGIMHDFGKGVSENNKTALHWYTKSAEQGDKYAQYRLGVLYSEGKGIRLDNKAAIKWFTLAAEQGHEKSQQNLIKMYKSGKGVPEDNKTLVKLSNSATENGPANFNKGVKAYKSVDFKTAVKWFTLAANQGLADAQYHLGIMYASGNGALRNYKTASKWYTLAAEQGHAEAQNRLGAAYQYGYGVLKNDKTAEKWFHLSAKQGYAMSQLALGISYSGTISGEFIDIKRAYMWFSLTDYNFVENDIIKRDFIVERMNNIAKDMTQTEISKAQDMASRCLASNYTDC